MHSSPWGLPTDLLALVAGGTICLSNREILARPFRGIGRAKKVANYGDGIGPRAKNVSGRLYCDSTDGDKRFSRQLPSLAHEIDSDNGIRVLLGSRREYRPHGNIIRRTVVRIHELLQVVCRNSHPQTITDDASSRIHGQVILANVNAASWDECRNVGPIVHDNPNARRDCVHDFTSREIH
jgi:hypothetical protein